MEAGGAARLSRGDQYPIEFSNFHYMKTDIDIDEVRSKCWLLCSVLLCSRIKSKQIRSIALVGIGVYCRVDSTF